jgi:hypothetical protein
MKRMTMVLLMALALPAGAEMYKWTSKGQVVFGDTPPNGVTYEPVLLRGKVANTPPVVAKPQQSGVTEGESLATGNRPAGNPAAVSNAATGSATAASGTVPAPVSEAAKRKADEEAKALARKQCKEVTDRTDQLLAMPLNKRPADFDARVTASKKDTAVVCR